MKQWIAILILFLIPTELFSRLPESEFSLEPETDKVLKKWCSLKDSNRFSWLKEKDLATLNHLYYLLAQNYPFVCHTKRKKFFKDSKRSILYKKIKNFAEVNQLGPGIVAHIGAFVTGYLTDGESFKETYLAKYKVSEEKLQQSLGYQKMEEGLNKIIEEKKLYGAQIDIEALIPYLKNLAKELEKQKEGINLPYRCIRDWSKAKTEKQKDECLSRWLILYCVKKFTSWAFPEAAATLRRYDDFAYHTPAYGGNDWALLRSQLGSEADFNKRLLYIDISHLRYTFGFITKDLPLMKILPTFDPKQFILVCIEAKEKMKGFDVPVKEFNTNVMNKKESALWWDDPNDKSQIHSFVHSPFGKIAYLRFSDQSQQSGIRCGSRNYDVYFQQDYSEKTELSEKDKKTIDKLVKAGSSKAPDYKSFFQKDLKKQKKLKMVFFYGKDGDNPKTDLYKEIPEGAMDFLKVLGFKETFSKKYENINEIFANELSDADVLIKSAHAGGTEKELASKVWPKGVLRRFSKTHFGKKIVVSIFDTDSLSNWGKDASYKPLKNPLPQVMARRPDLTLLYYNGSCWSESKGAGEFRYLASCGCAGAVCEIVSTTTQVGISFPQKIREWKNWRFSSYGGKKIRLEKGKLKGLKTSETWITGNHPRATFYGILQGWDYATIRIVARSFSKQARASDIIYGDDPRRDPKRYREWLEREFKKGMAPTKGYIGSKNKLYCSDQHSIIFTPDGKRFASIRMYENIIRIWDLEKQKEIASFEGHSWGLENLIKILISPDGKRLISASPDGTIGIWDLEKKKNIAFLKRYTDPIYNMEIHPDAKRVVGAKKDGTIGIWNLEEKKNIVFLKGQHTDSIFDIEITPNGKWVVSGSGDGNIGIWDLEEGKNIAFLKKHTDPIYNLEISPDGKRLISISYKNQGLWDLEKKKNIAFLERFSPYWKFTPDGKKAITSDWEKIIIWDLEEQKIIAFGGEDPEEIEHIAITPDGKRVVSASGDNTIGIWDLEERKNITFLKAAGGWQVNDVAITPDGMKAVSSHSGYPPFLSFWDFERLSPIMVEPIHHSWKPLEIK